MPATSDASGASFFKVVLIFPIRIHREHLNVFRNSIGELDLQPESFPCVLDRHIHNVNKINSAAHDGIPGTGKRF